MPSPSDEMMEIVQHDRQRLIPQLPTATPKWKSSTQILHGKWLRHVNLLQVFRLELNTPASCLGAGGWCGDSHKARCLLDWRRSMWVKRVWNNKNSRARDWQLASKTLATTRANHLIDIPKETQWSMNSSGFTTSTILLASNRDTNGHFYLRSEASQGKRGGIPSWVHPLPRDGWCCRVKSPCCLLCRSLVYYADNNNAGTNSLRRQRKIGSWIEEKNEDSFLPKVFVTSTLYSEYDCVSNARKFRAFRFCYMCYLGRGQLNSMSGNGSLIRTVMNHS